MCWWVDAQKTSVSDRTLTRLHCEVYTTKNVDATITISLNTGRGLRSSSRVLEKVFAPEPQFCAWPRTSFSLRAILVRSEGEGMTMRERFFTVNSMVASSVEEASVIE